MGTFSGGSEAMSSLITRGLAVIQRIVGKNSEYYKSIEEYFEKNILIVNRIKFVMGALDALYQDIKRDYLKSISELIHGDIFSDYLDMAKHLLEEDYKDASAVIGGSTLEEHLRKLCEKNDVEINLSTPKGIKPKKADTMNADLTKAEIFSKTQQKQVTAWLGIRNDAAHGHYDNYTKEEVKNMLSGLTDFFVNYPA